MKSEQLPRRKKPYQIVVTGQLGHVFYEGYYVTTRLLIAVNGVREVEHNKHERRACR